jgi:hypothetical protein
MTDTQRTLDGEPITDDEGNEGNILDLPPEERPLKLERDERYPVGFDE